MGDEAFLKLDVSQKESQLTVTMCLSYPASRSCDIRALNAAHSREKKLIESLFETHHLEGLMAPRWSRALQDKNVPARVSVCRGCNWNGRHWERSLLALLSTHDLSHPSM